MNGFGRMSRKIYKKENILSAASITPDSNFNAVTTS